MSSWFIIPELCACGQPATLRIRFMQTTPAGIRVSMLRYECKKCEHRGRLSITESEAAETFRDATA